MDTDKDGNSMGFVLGNITQPHRIDRSIVLSSEQYEKLSKGVMPDGQDDRWIVFRRGREFYFHRSWTGHRIYQVSFSNMDSEGRVIDTYSCPAFFVETNPETYVAQENDDDEAKNFQELINHITAG